MGDNDWLAERFDENRAHLHAVAHRVLGSLNEADDAVQETWLRLNRTDSSSVENLGGWLTTVVGRVCLDMLRSRRSRREHQMGVEVPDTANPDGASPEDAAVLADTIGPALLMVMDTLAPAERLAFVLHDVFAVPFDEIAPIVDRSPAAARKLASRARRRIQGNTPTSTVDNTAQRALVDAFLSASRGGDFEALLAVLDPDVVLRGDPSVVRMGAAAEVAGAAGVAETFAGRAQAARPALVDGIPGAVWTAGGHPRVVFGFTVRHGKIIGIDMIAAPETIDRLDLALVEE